MPVLTTTLSVTKQHFLLLYSGCHVLYMSSGSILAPLLPGTQANAISPQQTLECAILHYHSCLPAGHRSMRPSISAIWNLTVVLVLLQVAMGEQGATTSAVRNLPQDDIFNKPWVQHNIALTYSHKVQDGIGSQTLRVIAVYALSKTLRIGHRFRQLECVGHIGSHVHYRGIECKPESEADRRLLDKAQHMIHLPSTLTEDDVSTWDKKFLPSLDWEGFVAEVTAAWRHEQPTLFEVERLNSLIWSYPDLFLSVPELRPAAPPSPLVCRSHSSSSVPAQRSVIPTAAFHKKPWLLDALRVAVHIRRGDALADSWRSRLLSADYYINIVKQIADVLDKAGCFYSVEVYIEAPLGREQVAEIKYLRESISNAVMLVDTEMLWSWQMMASADIIVMSNSMFSMSAALLNPDAVSIHVPYDHYINRVGMFRMRHWVTPLDDEGQLPHEAVARISQRVVGTGSSDQPFRS